MVNLQGKIKIFGSDLEQARINNQVILSGTDDFTDANGRKVVAFLEYLSAGSAVNILDVNGNIVISAVTALDLTRSPLKLEGGVKFSGSINFAKLFFIEVV